ncbi:hypothetical protein [Vitiosangium sp. GDMCC 1.1324]|uniref:hypothetical protein n=1 Tax=Vitiosangium sp. (strain GDMCC 1.1324) TaxID=2138576 RepID=UPI000D344A65|nr:hypothetical protein [Vitiosangium sp. GDMCC 1.1324]PTL84686.1 hypothetical protein DAT35_06365 [Vitiosangium sp. GDMCC 1.1324]
MRNATSMEPPAGSSADLQAARQGCIELGRQAEGIAELVLPLLRQASQELSRMEAQRDELRKAARETPPTVLPRLLERIEEQSQHVKRLERASRGLRELGSAIGGLGEQFQSGLTRRDEELREQEAITREEKRMWLQELNTLREQVRAQGSQEKDTGPSAALQEELQRLRAEAEAMPRLRAERDRLAHRVAELEKNLTTREQTLTAKEQTIEDLRRMIVLLSGDPAASTPSSPTSPKPIPPPVSVAPLASPVAPPKPARPTEKPPDIMFGSSTMQLANSLLETLGPSEAPVGPSPVTPPLGIPERKVPSMEIMLGPLDELESPRPSLPPPIPTVPPVPVVSPSAAKAPMPRASARVAPKGPALTPAPIAVPPRPPPERPGTLVISEDMFNEVLIEENPPRGAGKK